MISLSLLGAHIFAIAGLGVVIHAAIGFDDAKDALAFYGVYHRDARNQIVHFFGVPGILWSMIIFMTHLKVPFMGGLTYGLLLTLFYLVLYLYTDQIGGTLYAPILYAMNASAVAMHRSDQVKCKAQHWAGTGQLMTFAFVVHIMSWYMQIHLGHKVYEGAQPAVLQSLGGALTVAPLFAFYEGLWLAGINKDLQRETLELVDKYTFDLCSSGAELRACESLKLD